MAIKNIYDTEISAVSFTWNGNTIATQAWVNANVSTPTLDAVTTSGSVTTNNLSVGSLNVTGGTIVSGVDTRTNVGIAIAKGDYLTSNDGSYIRNLIGLNSSSNIEIGQSGTSLISNIQLKPGSNGNIQFYASGSEDVRINSSGNVGIGTTSPVTGLDVRKSAYSNTTARFGETRPVYIINADSIIGFNQYYDGGWKAGTTGYSGNVGMNNSGEMYFNVSTASVATDGAVANRQAMKIFNDANITWGTGGTGSFGEGLLTMNSSWGTGKYPTLGSYNGSAGSLIMLHNPHIPFRTDNPASGYTGRAGLRMIYIKTALVNS